MDNDNSTWSDEDDAALSYEALPAWHPSLFVDVFRTALQVDASSNRQTLLEQAFVTPESRGAWGDFSRAAATFESGLKISMTALWAINEPDCAYVRLVETDAHLSSNLSSVAASVHVSLVWRPEIAIIPGSGWRIHALGDPVEPQHLPRTAPGFDPRSRT